MIFLILTSTPHQASVLLRLVMRGYTRTHPGLTKGTLAKNSSRLVSTPTQSLLQAWLLRETLIMIGGFIVTISSTALMVLRGRFTRLHHIPDHER